MQNKRLPLCGWEACPPKTKGAHSAMTPLIVLPLLVWVLEKEIPRRNKICKDFHLRKQRGNCENLGEPTDQKCKKPLPCVGVREWNLDKALNCHTVHGRLCKAIGEPISPGQFSEMSLCNQEWLCPNILAALSYSREPPMGSTGTAHTWRGISEHRGWTFGPWQPLWLEFC